MIDTVSFVCSHMGVTGTTDIHVAKLGDGTYEARCGIAVLGVTNMDEAGFKACDFNPFHIFFHDNYASGKGSTQQAALDALKADMLSTADCLWAL